ncbi:MAG: protein kinase [Gemmatimonadales bacterium]
MTILETLTAALKDRYAVEREIGAGGMATVYRAEDLKHKRPVAIKVLRPELAASLGSERFLREIELAARLQHPHILPVYDSGAAAGFLYYVMPFVEGESLRDRLSRGGPMPVEAAVQLTREVASALGYAHQHGVIHRDIKPENIMLSGGHAVVADFGIARAVDAASSEGGARLTGTGLAIGTPAYMSPEQATASDDVDARSDIYSLGCVLYEALTGEPAFSGPTVQSILTKNVMGPRPRPSTARQGISPALDQVLARALATEPAGRYATAAEFAEDLGRTHSMEVVARPMRRRQMLLAGIPAAILVLLGVWFGARALLARGPVKVGAETIAVLPFNTTGTAVEFLGEGMVDLLSTNLNAVGGITTIDPRNVLSRWRRDGANSGRDGALKIGQDLRAGSVVLGSVVAAGPSVRLNAELVSVSGTQLAHAQVSGSADSVLALVDSLSLSLLRDIWRSREPVPSLRVSAITTSSVDAIRAYLEGEKSYRQAKWDSAAAEFTRAVELDSTFALANFRLALTSGWQGGWQTRRSTLATEAAIRYADRLPPRERALIGGYRLFTQARVEAVDSMRRYVRQYPNDPDGWFMLADAQYHMNGLLGLSSEELRAPFDSVLARDSTLVPALIHPIELALGSRDSAGYARYMRLFTASADSAESAPYRLAGLAVWGANPDSALLLLASTAPSTGSWLGPLMARFRYPDGGVEVIDSVLAVAVGSMQAGDPGQVLASRIAVQVGFGRLQAARALMDSVRAINQDLALGLTLLPINAGLAPESFAPEAVSRIRQAPLNASPFVALARASLEIGSGHGDRAVQIVDEALRTTFRQPMPPGFAELLKAYRGVGRIIQGDTAAGIREVREGLRQSGHFGAEWNGGLARFHLAAALAATSATRDEGIRMLLHGLSNGSDIMYIPMAQLLAGRALEARGDRAGAAEAYGRFIRLWASADPSLHPRVEEARAGLARVTGEKQD